MKRQKLSKKSLPIQRRLKTLLTVFIGLVFISVPVLTYADRFDDQIRQIQAQNAQNQAHVGVLEVEADSLQSTINALQTQINGINIQIAANHAKDLDLQQKITAAELELAKQKKLLGENIRAMYLEGQITNLEILASSKDLSDFVDKQQYRTSVKNKIKTTYEKVTALKAELKTEKEEVEQLLKEQEALQAQVTAQQNEQSRLLNLNQQQIDGYNQQIKSNQAKIADLRRQQVLENIRLFGGGSQPGIPGGGGYPWGNAYCYSTGSVSGPCYDYNWRYSSSAFDPWGYTYRNCTSWVAYKLAADGKSGFSFLGNAANWPYNASARGFVVTFGSGAAAGNAAVNPNGYYGHVMYVEAVLGDGRVVVSDYNRLGDGLYRGPDGGNAGVLGQGGLVFIHF